MKSTRAAASATSCVNERCSGDPLCERPNAFSFCQAASTNCRNFASAPGCGSAATTSNPRARYSAVQLAPMAPVPITATRRTDLLNVPGRHLASCHDQGLPRAVVDRLRLWIRRHTEYPHQQITAAAVNL